MAPGVQTLPLRAASDPVARPRYLPIAEHGLIGDLHTAALVATDGTIDWYCCPRFDSPSVFGAILDAERGGVLRISPEGRDWTSKQRYLPDTNILITRFLTPAGVGEMRRVVTVRGRMRFVVDVAPRFDYARMPHALTLRPQGALFGWVSLKRPRRS
jgi:GH15 family glucan-1,4-alpha-glucosidase